MDWGMKNRLSRLIQADGHCFFLTRPGLPCIVAALLNWSHIISVKPLSQLTDSSSLQVFSYSSRSTWPWRVDRRALGCDA